ncbi:MAG: chemotaxis protein CheV [Desulfovibrionaceae bacterium]|nr:chemotaxis protein CheV [Desulfovibrionaceae bacterium]
MSQTAITNILLEAGTNELEIVEFYIDEALTEDDVARVEALEQMKGNSALGQKKENSREANSFLFQSSQEGQKTCYRGYYGVNVAKVTEIIRMPRVTELPELQSPSVKGAFNLRSRIVPLVDLGMWLGKLPAEDYIDTKAIVTEFNNVNTAFMVTGVNRIHRISWEEVEPPNEYVSSVSSDTIVGVVKFDDRIVFLLDLEKIVTSLNPKLALRLGDLGEDWDSSRSYRALIADDSPLIRGMQRDLLEKAGFKVTATNNGKQAWEYLLECKKKVEEEGRPLSDFVQVVVTDIEMPVMDGLNLTSRIKNDSLLRRLPVLIFSSLVTEKLRHRGESVGADGQISKPEVGSLAKRAADLIVAYEQKFADKKKTPASSGDEDSAS